MNFKICWDASSGHRVFMLCVDVLSTEESIYYASDLLIHPFNYAKSYDTTLFVFVWKKTFDF